jgi:hypothetical protein
MDDRDRDADIAALRERLSTLKAKRATLADECMHLAAWIPALRKEFGNPFYYSHPTEPDEGIANYNPNGHMGGTTLSEFMRVERELARTKDQLHRLGIHVKDRQETMNG